MEELSQFIFPASLLAIIGFMFFSQWRKGKDHRELLANLSEGDEVALNSGIHGFVASVDANILWLEVSEGVELKVALASVTTVLTSSGAEVEEEAEEVS